jgi:hypothetical protein
MARCIILLKNPESVWKLSCNVSSRTVCRRLFREGYKHRVVSKKITISQVNRFGFCRRKLHWTVDQWSHIIFSDETKIILGQNRKIYVWRKADERRRPECVGRRDDWETTCRLCLSYSVFYSSKNLHLTNLQLLLSAWGLVPYHAVPLLLSRWYFVYLRGIIKLCTTAGRL